jgi:uncharacterized membrane protein
MPKIDQRMLSHPRIGEEFYRPSTNVVPTRYQPVIITQGQATHAFHEPSKTSAPASPKKKAGKQKPNPTSPKGNVTAVQASSPNSPKKVPTETSPKAEVATPMPFFAPAESQDYTFRSMVREYARPFAYEETIPCVQYTSPL